MNKIQQITKDCQREDCSITGGNSGFSTCMGYTPTYDKHGKRTDRGDPNTFTTSYRCSTCKREWLVSTQYGESKITEHKREAAQSAE